MENSYLLISDVDGTLLGDDDALNEFADWFEARRDRIRLAYNSGRFVHSVRRSVQSTALPEPDAVIGGVGTQIRNFRTGVPVDGWPRYNGRWDAGRIAEILQQFDELEPQPGEFQSEFKISWFARGVPREFLSTVKRTVQQAGFDVELIYSSRRDLDLLPAGVSKGSASAFLARHWGTPPERVIVSGDSGNDSTLFDHSFRGIVVDNAHPELKSLDDPHIYQSSRPYAGGVLEGLKYWLTAAGEE